MAELWDDVNHDVLTSDLAVNAIFSLLQTLTHEYVQRMTAIFWSLWKHRNLMIWKDENEMCANVVDRARHLVDDCRPQIAPQRTIYQQQEMQGNATCVQHMEKIMLSSSSGTTAQPRW